MAPLFGELPTVRDAPALLTTPAMDSGAPAQAPEATSELLADPGSSWSIRSGSLPLRCRLSVFAPPSEKATRTAFDVAPGSGAATTKMVKAVVWYRPPGSPRAKDDDPSERRGAVAAEGRRGGAVQARRVCVSGLVGPHGRARRVGVPDEPEGQVLRLGDGDGTAAGARDAPLFPHADDPVAWQFPVASQHPLGQLAALHTH